MIKVLFKSEELLIAADSESAVVYGNTTKNTVIEYLSNLTPKNGEEAMSISMLIILLTTSKYVVAKHIKTKVVVKTAEDAIRIAAKFNLEEEVQRELDNGATPLEALKEWDII